MAVDQEALPTLKLGSRGPAVSAAKMGFNHWDAKEGNTSPLFGVFFRANIKTFQAAVGIPATGVIGPATWNALLPHIPPKGKALLPQKAVVPNLGPVVRGGQSVLQHDCTHATSGIPLYPAFDDGFAEGLSVLAPEALVVTRQSSSHPGKAFYADGTSGMRYWFGHLVASPAVGTKFKKGAVVGKVIANNIGGGPHVHVGCNVEKLWGKGKELAHHTNYTHGAPTIGAQLKVRGDL